MANEVMSLFGVTPEALQAQREQQAYTQGIQLAQLDPFQRAYAQTYSGASGLGREISGLLGVEDPELRLIKQRQGILQGIDLTNADSLKQGIQTAMQNKDYALVSELTSRYQDSVKAGLEAQKTNSEIQKNLREGQTNEMKNAQSAADMSGAARGSEEWNKAFNTKFNELLAKNPSIDNIGVAVGSQIPVYFDKNTNQQFTIKDGQRVAYNGGVDRTTAKVTATATSKGESAFAERLGGKDADRVDSAISARESAVAQLDIADRIEAMSPTALSGQFANGRLGMVNFLDTLGLTSPKDKQVLMSSQVLTADSSRLLLAALNNKLGGGVSNQDAKRVEEIFPQLEHSPAARKELVNIIRRSANKVIEESIALEDYARKHNGLGGYRSAVKLPGASVRNPYADLSDEELAARIKAAQAKQQR